jgi:GNAT superfamily N-acetyltransferase
MPAIRRHDTPDAALAAAITALHREVYGAEQPWNEEFIAYVADGLASYLVEARPGRDAIWTVSDGDRLLASVAVWQHADGRAQLRWFVVHPASRGAGIGRALLDAAVAFARDRGVRELFLWTVAGLDAAAHLYHRAGFRCVESVRAQRWGSHITEERHQLRIDVSS